MHYFFTDINCIIYFLAFIKIAYYFNINFAFKHAPIIKIL